MIQLDVRAEWLRGLVDFVFPPLCLGCSDYTEDSFAVCKSCMAAIDTFEYPFCLGCMNVMTAGTTCPTCESESLALFAYGNYAAPLEQIIIQYKFKGITRSARLFAELIAETFGERIKSLGCRTLIPIPLYPRRENYRGYNQAAILARHLSKRLELEVIEDVLVRAKGRKPQARLNHHQRAVNIRGVFGVAEDVEIPDRAILVDDVVTSGATIREAARVLRKAGVKISGAISIAHAL